MNPTYLEQLNPQQLEAVRCTDAPSLVIAGAGSGKTRVLTAKIAYLIDAAGIPPQHIMALTFTNKAAREMQQRVSTIVGEGTARMLIMGTFHSAFARILRHMSQHTGYAPGFTIYDTSDSKTLIKHIIKDMQLDEKQYKPASVLARISNAKNHLLLPDAYAGKPELLHRDQECDMPATGQIYHTYQERLRQSNAMDFDDLLLQTWRMFDQHPEVADFYQDWLEYILVDEYQDTNYAQHQIILQLTHKRQRICVVGDDAQSIYSFRGAEIGNILHFRDAYSQARLFKLEQNYRSTQTIVDAASSLIGHNSRQIPKHVFSQQDKGAPIEVFYTYSDTDEAATITRHLSRLHSLHHLPYSDMAVLYRTNNQSRSIEEELRKQGIPYHIYGGQSFYQRKEVKDVIAYLRLCTNLHDEEALRRVVNYPARGIGATTQERVWKAAYSHGTHPWEVLAQATDYGIGKAPAKKLADFATMIQQLHDEAEGGADAYSITLRMLAQSGVQADIMQGTEPDDQSRQQNLQELSDSISSFVQERKEQGQPASLQDYLQEVSLLTDQEEDNDDNDGEHITLMTVHAAKGLEFQAVCVVGLEESLFPSQMAQEDPLGVEEERRLFYVAMTRAGKYLSLSCARSRMRYGHLEFSEPSRFLGEISPDFLHVNGKSPLGSRTFQSRPFFTSQAASSRTTLPFGGNKPAASPARQAQPVPRAASPISHQGTPLSARLRPLQPQSVATGKTRPGTPSLAPGQHIVHERFGEGVIEAIEGSGMDARAVVMFQNAGRKQLLLRFARFTLA